MGILKRIWRNSFLLGLLSLAWLLLRSGAKPSRLNYPCQQAAKSNILASAGLIIAPVIAATHMKERRLNSKWIATAFIVLAVFAVGYTFLMSQESSPSARGSYGSG